MAGRATPAMENAALDTETALIVTEFVPLEVRVTGLVRALPASTSPNAREEVLKLRVPLDVDAAFS